MKSNRQLDLRFNDLSSCLHEMIDLGCFYSHLSTELISIKVFTYTKSLLDMKTNENDRIEILAILYQCCRNMLGEHREEICTFIDTIGDYMVAFFRKKDLSEKHKMIRIKFMDMLLIAHCPNLGRSDQTSMEFIPNRQSWMKLLSEFDIVINNELSQSIAKYRDKKAIELHPIIAQCAARFCYYYHWSDQRDDMEEDEPSTSKRARVITKMDFIMEKIRPSPNNFNWKWLIVMGELMHNYNDSVRSEDVPEILKMLSELQPSIDYTKGANGQIYALTKCCYVIIQKEKMITNQHVINLCKDLWMKIGDEVVRVCAGSTNGSSEAHLLLQFLIRYEKCSTSGFIESVLKIFTSGTVNRNDKTLKTLITILKSFNLDSLANGKDLSSKILNYAFLKPTMATLKKVITSGNEKPSNAVLSELATCCCLMKTDVINFVKKNQKFNDEEMFEQTWDLKNQIEYLKEVEMATRLIRKKNLNLLILEDEDFLKVNLNFKYFIF